jgi:hypothetical protein
LLLGVTYPFCRHQHSFPEGRQYLDSHYLSNERSHTTQGEPQLLPAVVDPRNIQFQHFLMLRWVLLCDYCSYFLYFPNTSKLGWAINAYKIRDISYRYHCLLFRVCSSVELSSAFITTTPEGAAVVYINTPFLFELHDMSMGHARLICTQFIFTHLMEDWVLQVPFSLQWGTLDTLIIALSYNDTLSRRNIDEFWLYVCS